MVKIAARVGGKLLHNSGSVKKSFHKKSSDQIQKISKLSKTILSDMDKLIDRLDGQDKKDFRKLKSLISDSIVQDHESLSSCLSLTKAYLDCVESNLEFDLLAQKNGIADQLEFLTMRMDNHAQLEIDKHKCVEAVRNFEMLFSNKSETFLKIFKDAISEIHDKKSQGLLKDIHKRYSHYQDIMHGKITSIYSYYE